MSEVISLLKDFLFLAIAVMLFLVLIFLFSYKFVYRKLMHGQKEIKFKSLVLPLIFIGYLVIVFGATFLSRSDVYFGNTNFHLFSSYKEAFITASARNWRNIILNILLFVPIGALLPLLNKKLRKPYISITIGLLITLFIETIQTIFHIGIFEIDDIFNNALGTVIGYFLINIMFVIRNKEENKKALKVLLSILPLLITILSFIIIFVAYNSQSFGNLNVQYINKINMKNVTIENEIKDLNNNSKTADIYKSKIYSKDEVREIAKKVFGNVGSTISENNAPLFYEQTAIFYTDNEQSIWIEYIGGTYNFNNNSIPVKKENISSEPVSENDNNGVTESVSNYNPDPIREDVTKEEIIQLLESVGITLDFDYTYEVDNKNNHIIKVDKFEKDGALIDGSIICNIKTSGNYSLNNKIITYTKCNEADIISESDAYKMLESGKFKISTNEKIEKLDIISVNLTYMLDSKAFYQPVYKFSTHLNNSNEVQDIYIPAMK